MSSTNSPSNNGIGFVGLLTITFIVLKLTHVVGWSWWWWVLSPFWITAGIIALILTIMALVGLVVICGARKRKAWF